MARTVILYLMSPQEAPRPDYLALRRRHRRTPLHVLVAPEMG